MHAASSSAAWSARHKRPRSPCAASVRAALCMPCTKGWLWPSTLADQGHKWIGFRSPDNSPYWRPVLAGRSHWSMQASAGARGLLARGGRVASAGARRTR